MDTREYSCRNGRYKNTFYKYVLLTKKFNRNVPISLQKYALTLSKQVQMMNVGAEGKQQFGLSLNDLDCFTDEQLAQLYQLYQESSKPPVTQ